MASLYVMVGGRREIGSGCGSEILGVFILLMIVWNREMGSILLSKGIKNNSK